MDPARTGQIFLLVPEELADELLDALREHYAGDAAVTPIVERRKGERRSGIDRRMLRLPVDGDRRTSTAEQRRTPDRRAPMLPRDLSSTLPPDLAGHAEILHWAQRLDPVTPHHAALPTQALVEAIAAGHLSCAAELYWRCYERIYQRLRTHMDSLTADAKTQGAFGRLLDRLPDFDPAAYDEVHPPSTPFDLFVEDVVDELAAEVTAG